MAKLARYWHEMTTEDFDGFDPERTVAILPVGAIEQHGPHLPVWVDACINQGVVRHAVELMPDDLPVTVLPMQSVGKSNEHIAFPGTLTLSSETLRRLWTEIGEGVNRAGVRKLLLFNSHGGQPQVMQIVARDLRVRLDMFVVTCNWPAFGIPEDLFPAEERRWGIHAGSVETSMMMYLAPDLVRTDKAQDFTPKLAGLDERYKHLNLIGPVNAGWQAQDLHPAGAAGNALDADAARGQAVVEHAARGLVEMLHEMVDYPLANLAAGPLE